ncbi:MAG TPA: ABC transporter ATP-binding protein [Candidatus Deferrimicrobiaceae bacterium]
MTAPLLSARRLSFRYGEREVLREVDLDLHPGRVTILLGPNGSGKSTLIRVLSGVLPSGGGEVLLAGRPPGSYGRREMARLLSVVGQDPPVDFPMTVAAYVALGRFPHQGLFGGTSAADREEVERALVVTGLDLLRDRALPEISAGERQRATVARAIAQGARVMLLDEPTAFLDIRHRVAFYEIVTRLAGTRGVAALVASHDLTLCAEYGERIVLLSEGAVASQGRPEEVLTPSSIRAAYGVAVACDRNPATGAVRVTPLRGTLAGDNLPLHPPKDQECPPEGESVRVDEGKEKR